MDSRISDTTERTCETCDLAKAVRGALERARPYEDESGVIKISLGDFCALRKAIDKPPKPRPSAQDADECKAAFIDVYGISYDEMDRLGKTIYRDEWDLWQECWKRATKNRRPSLPMSAEVEKAVDFVRSVLYATIPEETIDSVMMRFDLIAAALKARG